MEELVILKNDQALTDSLTVAEMFGKRHADVIRAIENKIENDSTQNCVKCFFKTRYKDASGKWSTKYLMNKKAFSFLVMGFTGKKADMWKWKYIEAFEKMEELLRETHTQPWITTRNRSKLIRKQETDVIQKLVEYAKEQGSTHSDMLYRVYSRLANTAAGIDSRDESDVEELCLLIQCEGMIEHVIEQGMAEEKFYKDIYKDCKKRLDDFLHIGFLDTRERSVIGCRS